MHPPLRDVYDAAIPFTGHHREYTAAELRELIGWSGLELSGETAYNYTPGARSYGGLYWAHVRHGPGAHLALARRGVLMVRAPAKPAAGMTSTARAPAIDSSAASATLCAA